ncbi:MAG: hypothetical protein A3I07_03760 [Candidatus Doudnabacteria bacterium RIFCSPLOWO2_02_FULL_42_9]|uniref:DUF4134 domain-containing protein n=1 Tax=Candidatus Doudnabacteria bacterium RIFCSPHIGHO2_01_FULL_41_86 TaxID=1817821 RepID=A0A1F5N8L5_9BACT|nr:MAG: hypothetical protein A2717_00550 [Candidatus Doudnabacteria bacterium RIFCSPHIGHO2_01_FULL_41_86]OGE75143.1 MAG: hypothetical protein A3K07_01500 [Candidatus Doudnabacteria bacterium RIFCSPHIGHO2_01_43_10]OGE86432.1 MAG: hypothetical protein A3E28_00425 [Candidatus Doudnabacteria bacterium RIFCSPHIGHO2_12_FULL_42_22]OGE87431.1 MAG: hypothetical protein A3C49_04410 [Candidatus Doudnabacteria bacterium RIFCSPHIGHO2_02_FULL_42_25]OGE92729.1 MAG: hypothetical protein A2895_03905 [Candidatus
MSRIKYISLILLSLPSVAFAQIIPDRIPGLPGDQYSTVSNALTEIIQTVLVVVGLIAVAFLIYGGFRYITSAGNEETAESAKKTIQNAIIGLVVIILSYIIVVVISNALLTSDI